mgnify:CR=1 FL=1
MTQRCYQGSAFLLPEQPPSVVCIGRFDGVHLGHQALMAQGRALADQLGVSLTVLCFDPHPNALFGRPVPMPLTSIDRRFELFQRYGATDCLCLTFDADFAALSWRAFLDSILVQCLQVQGVVVGHDFRFGSGRLGTVDCLKTWGEQQGVSIRIVSPIRHKGRLISTSWCRDCLMQRDHFVLAQLLGRTD